MKSVQANQTQCLSVLLCLDVSGSMGVPANPAFGPPLADVNAALGPFLKDLSEVTHAAVELMVVKFSDSIAVEADFEAVQKLTAPRCSVSGSGTDLGGAIARSLDELQARSAYLTQIGIEVPTPWLIVMTDGQPNLCTSPGFQDRLVQLVKTKQVNFLPVAVGGYASYDVLERLSPLIKPVIVGAADAGSLSFAQFFRRVSVAMASGRAPNFADLQQSHD